MWESIFIGQEPSHDQDLHLAVIDEQGIHSLVFPCRRGDSHWINSHTQAVVHVHPTHWRLWQEDFRNGL